MYSSKPSDPRSGYVTQSRHQLDERQLLLRGGPLDGLRWAVVASVGQRVLCGDGPWAMERLYVVTAETTDDAGQVRSIAVPAFADSAEGR